MDLVVLRGELGLFHHHTQFYLPVLLYFHLISHHSHQFAVLVLVSPEKWGQIYLISAATVP